MNNINKIFRHNTFDHTKQTAAFLSRLYFEFWSWRVDMIIFFSVKAEGNILLDVIIKELKEIISWKDQRKDRLWLEFLKSSGDIIAIL